MRKLWLALFLLLPFAACSGGNDTPARPAGEVLKEAGRDEHGRRIKDGEVGGAAVDINGILLTVTEVGEPYELPGGEPVIDLSVRAENRGDEEDASSPDFLLQCSGEDQAHYGGSYEAGSPLPRDTFVEGKVIAEYPADCDEPTVVATFVVTIGDDPVAHWPL